MKSRRIATVLPARTIARTCLVLILLAMAGVTGSSEEPCLEIHGRAHLYQGDGQLRIWHIGTHHEFVPADDASSALLRRYLESAEDWQAAQSRYLFADFTLCPTEPYTQGSVQTAVISKIRNAKVIVRPR